MPDVAPSPPATFVTRVRRVLRDLGPTAPLLAVATALPLAGTVVLAATSAHWLPWFDGDLASVLGYWLGGAFAAAACLLPTHATSLLAGYLFGSALGAVVAWLVVVLAAAVAFAVWQRWVGTRAVQAIAGSPRALAVHRALLGRGLGRTVWVIALLRLSPVMPFAATNLLLAAFGVRALPFVLATVLGTTPRAVGAAVVGAGLAELDWGASGGAWTTWLAVGATVLAVVLIGRVARAALRREVGDLGPAGP
ncbi:MAG: VTT domain-containing protein [Planctomycetes bacterium]|nr:VTT domain-containing protein [Planctomycetota bacterium]